MGQLHGRHHSSRVDPTWLLWRRWLVDVSQRSNEKRIEKTCSLNQSTCRSHRHSWMRAVRIFLFTSLSHCKVHYWFDREGAVSWLHHPKALAQHQLRASCLCQSDVTRICSTAAKDYLVSALPTVEEQQAGEPNIQRHILLPLQNVCLGGGMRGYPGCFLHFRPCPPDNMETPMSFPCHEAYLCTCCLTACSRCTGSYKVQKLDIDNVQASWHLVYKTWVCFLAFFVCIACEILWRYQMYSKIMIYKRICVYIELYWCM